MMAARNALPILHSPLFLWEREPVSFSGREKETGSQKKRADALIGPYSVYREYAKGTDNLSVPWFLIFYDRCECRTEPGPEAERLIHGLVTGRAGDGQAGEVLMYCKCLCRMG